LGKLCAALVVICIILPKVTEGTFGTVVVERLTTIPHFRKSHHSKPRAGLFRMKRFHWLQYTAAGIAGFGLVLPSGLLAADASRAPVLATAAETPSILDVSLGKDAALVGQVLDVQGAPMAQTTVTIRSSGADVASAVTDAQGSFSISGLQGGVYEVTAAGGSGTFRVWTAEASPPSASKGVLIVSGGQTTRGQFFRGPNKAGALVMVGLLGGVVAAGIITAAQRPGS
jgi:hypothetical protein